MNKKISKHLCYIFLFIPIILTFIINISSECDIWFLLSHGRYVLNHGFPHTDFLTMHSGLHFVMQQWLSSIIFYSFYKIFGVLGIYFIVWGANFIILFLLYKLCIKINNNKFISSMITIIVDVLLSFISITCRPIIFSLIIYILLFYIMESYRRQESKIIYFLILLSLLEINLHASMWPILFILLGPYVVYYVYSYYIDKNKFIFKLLFILLLMILVGFINPYGIEAMTYSLRSYGIPDINNMIWEMNGLSLNSDLKYVQFFGYLTLFVMIGVSYLFIRSKKKVDFYKLLFFYGTYFMALLNIRNVSLFYICRLVFCSEYIDLKLEIDNRFYKKYIWGYVFAFLLLVCVIILNRESYVLLKKAGQYDVLNYMNCNIDAGEVIYTGNFDGSYYSFYGYKTYIDTRAELFLKVNNHKEDIFHEYYLLMNGKLQYDLFLEKYHFKYLVVDKREPIYQYLKSNDFYHLLYKSKKTYLYMKND